MDEFVPLWDEFQQLRLAREHFPMWTEWGIEDAFTAVHSLGLSYLVTVGQALGFAACAEYPVDPSIRSDGVWWDKVTREPMAIFEFERYKDGSELRDKVQNLLIAYHRLNLQPRLLSLIYWTKNFYPLGDEVTQELWSIVMHGFRTSTGQTITGADPRLLRIFEVQHRAAEGSKFSLKGFSERRRS
ncbi:hypothetical protein KI809_11480 [Geobacter pelophilus]|uniref:Uncharacterized protein n=1 Tax=Geoanaerobacter pelophilus TaxID=60036 RepID=A0AAW4L403_9BACT|nr:hypothetical protein [Geoanaerobacter pelophilus]MBT0664922.1 hypothetical protein [Geoanaerobacter pelophilus]